MRADKFFAEKFGSRTKSKEALSRGLVLKNGKPVCYKEEVREGEEFTFLTPEESYVSNGGYKLAQGLNFFQEDVFDKIYADLGASTGGFTHCLLKRGAKKVFCIDVGESLLAPELAKDSRVVVMDNTNARYLTKESFKEEIDGVVSDLSFISLKLILPAISQILPNGGNAFVLFKPQFECEGKGLGKSGILPQSYHAKLLSNFYGECLKFSLAPQNIVNAPLREKKNIEYVLHLKKNGVAISLIEWERRANSLIK